MSGAEPFRLSFHTFYFPAWQVRVDGAHAPTFPSGALGLVSADIPAGEHFVTLAYEGTTFQHIGEAVSLIAAVFVVWSLLSANFPLPMGQRSGTLVAGLG